MGEIAERILALSNQKNVKQVKEKVYCLFLPIGGFFPASATLSS